jgi:hypothetical protein
MTVSAGTIKGFGGGGGGAGVAAAGEGAACCIAVELEASAPVAGAPAAASGVDGVVDVAGADLLQPKRIRANARPVTGK